VGLVPLAPNTSDVRSHEIASLICARHRLCNCARVFAAAGDPSDP
jgi:hypothetical protein